MTTSTPFPSGSIRCVSGTTVVVRGDDIDTDRIIPARFLKCVTFEALGPAAFADDRAELADSPAGPHPFDRPEHQGASILLVNRNFGCGSSREHAPQALMRWGIRAVVGESFAEIFYGNCLALGIPCLVADHDTMLAIQAAAEADPGRIPRIVHHAVERTKTLASPAEARMVNAVVRRLAEPLAQPPPPADADATVLAEYFSHPVWLVRAWLAQFGPVATRSLLEWNQTPAPVHGRWRGPPAPRRQQSSAPPP